MEQYDTATQKCVDERVQPGDSIFVDLSPLPAVAADEQGRIVASNRAVCNLFKKESLASQSLFDLSRSGEEMRGFLNGKGVAELEFNIDGELIQCEAFHRPRPEGGWLIVLNDISERRKNERAHFASEKQKWKIQRTEALERLAGGIAHEFNNYLAVILLQADMINMQIADESPVAGRVNEIKAVANDAASVVRQLLAFGRRQSMNPAPFVLNELFAPIERDLKALVGNAISVEFDLAENLGVCFVDQSQIIQAMMYLTLNAKQNMPNGGTLAFRTTNIDKGGQLIHRTQSSGAYIQIEVSDTGSGVETRPVEHIFEPFFSAKGSRENSGLALATVYGIVKQSGGYIWVTNVPGEGSKFRIQFPRIDEPRMTKPQTAAKSSATILLVDDEISVRRVAAEALRGAGYRVIEAASGEEAVETARTFPEKFDLVIADYLMPSMNGADAYERVRQIHRDAKVIFISGDPSSLSEQDPSMILTKPFSLADLVEKVSHALGS